MIDKERFFDAFPAGSYAISGWLRLLDFQESREVETAAIRSGGGHVILVNPDFVARHAPTPERQVMLVLHELMHLLLGHQLRPTTPLDNLAFYAVINALLCRMLRDRSYWSLFTAYYSANAFPECLLRPPADFAPGSPVSLPRGLSGQEFREFRKIYRELYGEYGATYSDLREHLRRFLAARQHPAGLSLSYLDSLRRGKNRRAPEAGRLSQGEDATERRGRARGGTRRKYLEESPSDPVTWAAFSGVRLLGDHPVQERDWADMDFHWLEWVRGILAEMAKGAKGRGWSRGEMVLAMPPHPARERENAVRIARLIGRVAREGAAPSRRANEDRIRSATAVHALDRKSNILRFLGLQPLLYAWEIPVETKSGIEKVQLYVDVSGSVFEFIPSFYSAVLQCHDLVRPTVCLFSNIVANASWKELRAGAVKTSGGTDINCVLAHMRQHRILRAVILTDGYAGSPAEEFREFLGQAILGIALSPDGDRGYMQNYVRHWEVLEGRNASRAAFERTEYQ